VLGPSVAVSIRELEAAVTGVTARVRQLDACLLLLLGYRDRLAFELVGETLVARLLLEVPIVEGSAGAEPGRLLFGCGRG
jgi:hypothetical protein